MTETKNGSVYSDPELEYLFETINDSERIRKGIVPAGYPEGLAEMYDQYEMTILTPGKVVEAKLVGESDDDYLFDANAKDYIRVTKNRTEFAFLEGHKFGDTFEVAVLTIYDEPFWIKGSIAALHEAQVHEELKALDKDQHVEAYVKELTPAGYNMRITHNHITLNAFMPHTLAGINKLHDSARELLVGKTLNVMIESYAGDKGTYIVSRRKYLKTLMPKEIKKLNTEDVYTGHVTGTTPFGVFIEFNECLTGMIHKSNIHPDWQNKIQEIKAGTEIDFFVKEIIKNKIILTQIQKESLWDTIRVGQKLDGIVRDSKNFGVLVNLDEETVGLVHTSEIEKSESKTTYERGDQILVKVLAIDRMNRKIFLSLDKK
ncbi:MAG: 30S ribosomal protein S1 [uncultured marine phage]|uniref:30S ribosomal protein S1 n=1 Tax=uncultured marine phage TaxID=707152 RepID=A0A8D9CG03_9VIRU|nr:MAG: 30S ribosomal protein S1 [uncultured marine phage]